MYDELVKRLRELQSITEHCDEQPCSECENRELCDKHDNKTLSGTYKEAADAIEELQNKLCDWCGVCPKERRRPSGCEIIYPNMQVPEIAIIPTEEGET